MDLSEGFKALVGDTEPLSSENLGKMSHASLYNLRKTYSGNEDAQKAISPYEHRAYAKEAVAENVWMAPVLAVATPAYQLAKLSGIDIGETEEKGMATPPSSKQLTFGLEGIGEGLKEALGFKTEEKASQVSEGQIKYTKKEDDFEGKINQVIDRLIFTESGGVHEKNGELTTSPVGAKGITQVMPKTGVSPGYGVAPLKNSTKEEYVRFAKDYLGAMLKKFGDMDKALAAYNAGPGKITRALNRAERKGKDWKEFIPKETQDYIKKVQLEENKGLA